MTYKDIISQPRVLLVEFYADWCPHCQRMMPIVKNVEKQLLQRVTVKQIDIDRNKKLADEAGVQSIPTFFVYKDGTLVWSHTGELTEEALTQGIEKAL